MDIKAKIERVKVIDSSILLMGYAFIDNGEVNRLKKVLIVENKERKIKYSYVLEPELRTDLEFEFKDDIDCKDISGFKSIEVDLCELAKFEGEWNFYFKFFNDEFSIIKPVEILLAEFKNLIRPQILNIQEQHISINPKFIENKFLNICVKNINKKEAFKLKIKNLKKLLSTIKRLLKDGKSKEVKILILYFLLGKNLRKKKLYILGERRDTAQDNTYHLFKYMNDQNFKNIYYIIDKRAKDYEKIKEYKNILDFGSIKHTLYLLSSAITINSYVERNNMYSEEYKNIIKYFPWIQKNKKIFLQHGVIGVSRVNHSLHKNKVNYDRFIVSSDFEKEHIIKEYGYKQDEVVVTGLARWDKLQERSEKNRVLLMPTWRKWIKSEEELGESNYLKTYISLLNNSKLKEFLVKNNIELSFYPHYQIQKIFKEIKIENPKVKLIRKEDISVQELINMNSFLITDYSTVAFDFAYLKKQVLFYQFDYEEFYGKHYNQGPINHKCDLFGVVSKSEDELIDRIIEAYEDNYMEKKFLDKSNRYIKYRDKNNRKRILDVVKEV